MATIRNVRLNIFSRSHRLSCSARLVRLLRAMPRGIGPRLRYLVDLIHQDFDAHADKYAEIKLALEAFEDAVNVCLPEERRQRRAKGRPRATPSTQVNRLKWQLQWARRARRTAEEQLKKLTIGKQRASKNRLTPEFIAKVALSKPSTVARAFADAWQDLVGVGVAGCGRTSITNIRDAFRGGRHAVQPGRCCKGSCAPGSCAPRRFARQLRAKRLPDGGTAAHP